MRRRARTDENQAALVRDLRTLGASVAPLHQLGKGIPDLLVGYRGANWLVEVKRDEKAKLTPDQVAFHAAWAGPIVVATTLDDFLLAVQERQAEPP